MVFFLDGRYWEFLAEELSQKCGTGYTKLIIVGALLPEEIATVLAYETTDFDELRVYLVSLLTTACRPLSSLLFNDASIFV